MHILFAFVVPPSYKFYLFCFPNVLCCVSRMISENLHIVIFVWYMLLKKISVCFSLVFHKEVHSAEFRWVSFWHLFGSLIHIGKWSLSYSFRRTSKSRYSERTCLQKWQIKHRKITRECLNLVLVQCCIN